MNLQTISIKKLNSIYISKKENTNVDIDTSLLLQLQLEAMTLGFIFTDEAVSALSVNLDIYTDVLSTLSELVGANKVWRPFYRNFPKEVFNTSDIELYINAINHYTSFGEWKPEEKTSSESKVPVFEKVNFKKIGLCDKTDIDNLFKSIVSSNGSITDFDRESIVYAIKNWDKSWITNVDIKFKETLCFFIGHLFTENVILDTYPSVKTATDVLRIACHLSDGDITLVKETNFKLKNRERKFIVKLLEPVIKEEEIAKYKSDWIHLFHHLHIGTYKKAKKSNIVAKKLREDKVRTLNSKIEIALRDKDNKALIELLPKNMGDFGRRLDHIIRTFDSSYISVFILPENIAKIDTRVLLQILSHFYYRNEREIRVVIPKGETRKAHILPNHKELPDHVILLLTSNIEKELRRRFTEKEKLGKVFIDSALKKAPIPMQMRTASDGLFVMQRGTRVSLGNDKPVLRFFINWIGNDVDLSACFLTEDLNFHSYITYYKLKTTEGVEAAHSGDITYAPAPNGACEFIDINLDSITDKSIRYISLDVRNYSGAPLPEQSTNAGWMLRDEVASQRGEVFDAKTVEQRVALNAKQHALVALFDVQEREVIWLDMEGQSDSLYGGNNVASNKASIKQIAEIAIKAKNISLYDLLKLHAESRGEIVYDIENAETIYDKNWIFRYTDVLSEYI